MDAGARGRRLLQRREYKAKVSEFVPKELEDHVVYESEFLKKVGSKLKQGFKNFINKPIMKPNITKDQHLQKIKNSGGDPSHWANSYKPEGEMIEASSAQMKAMHDAKMRKKEDDKVKEKKKMSEDMKGMSQKSGDKRSTESGAGMTAKGVAKYNRRTGGNLKTAVTTPPSKLTAGSKAANRRKAFCARSKSWDGPRGKAARRRWNCEYEPELPMIEEGKKKLYNTSPLSSRVASWSKSIKEGDSYVKSDRNKFGLPKDLKSVEKKSDKKVTTGVNYGAMAQSYEPQGELIEMGRKGGGAINTDVLKNNPNLDPTKPGDYIKLKRLSAKVKNINNIEEKKKLNPNAVFPTVSNVKIKNEIISDSGISNKNSVKKKFPTEAKMTSSEKDKKEKYVKGMKKDKKGFTKRYGKDGESVMYATATKMAMKEESCGKGEYYCYDDKKCKPIPEGMKVGKDGMLVKEAKVDQGKDDAAKRNERNQRTFGNKRDSKGSMASTDDTEARRYNTKKGRGVKMKGKKDKTPVNYHKKDSEARVDALLKSMKEDFYKKKYDVRKGGYQKTNKMTKSNKRSGDSKAQYRQVHKDLAKENALIDKIKNDFNFIKKAKDTVNKYNSKLKQNNDAINKIMPGTATLSNEGSLHKWFKGSKSKDGKGGWVNVVTGGTCASDKPGEGTPKCVSSSKRASMTKAERLSASRRKKKADPNQQSKSGAAKPTYVATDKKKKKVNESPITPKNYDPIPQDVLGVHTNRIRTLDMIKKSNEKFKQGTGFGLDIPLVKKKTVSKMA